MKKIPHGSKVVNIMIGESDVLDRMAAAFVRLKVSSVDFFNIIERLRLPKGITTFDFGSLSYYCASRLTASDRNMNRYT